jgi:hypothetical protein
MKKLRVAAISACLVCLVLAGFSQYSDAAVIYGCYGRFAGVLRIVLGPGECSRWENPISWNSEGLAGGGNGISAAVHGTVSTDGSILSGTGFTVNHDGTGVYSITFNASFSTTPDCISHSTYTASPYFSCTAVGTSTSNVSVQCTTPGVYCDSNTGGMCYLDPESFVFVDERFTFICVD